MNKNKILIITGIITLFVGGYFMFFDKRVRYPESTGGKFETPAPEIQKMGDAINELQKSLPFATDSFTITKFDYKTARFVVEFKEKKETNKTEFFEWLKTTKFSPLPEKRFELKI